MLRFQTGYAAGALHPIAKNWHYLAIIREPA
jgi:hypothetical protein